MQRAGAQRFDLKREFDVSPVNDDTSRLGYDGAFSGPLRKEGIDEAVEMLGGADRLCHPIGQNL